MIDLNAVNDEIKRLEEDDLTYRIAEKLAVLYTIRREGDTGTTARSVDENPTEFEMIANSISKSKLIDALNEHVEAVRIMYPKEYELIMEKIRKAKN